VPGDHVPPGFLLGVYADDGGEIIKQGRFFVTKQLDQGDLTADAEMVIDIADIAFDGMRAEVKKSGDLTAGVSVQ
jgi:hypothetical protein